MLRNHALHAAAFALALMMPSPGQADTLQDEAQGAASTWDAAYNGGDMDKLAKLYAPDAIVVTKGGPQTNDGIPKFFSGLKAKGWDAHKTTVKTALPKDNLLIVSGRWEMSGPADGGAKKTFEGNWVNVLEKRDGAWRTVLHTWN